MTDPNFIILYVDSPANSAQFYAGILETPPIEASPTFIMFALASGVMLGLWARNDVLPAATAGAGSGELAFSVADHVAVNALYSEWSQRGMTISQEPVKLDFGFTFVALDLDGNRLRVFAPG